jgi:hypothetical protein
VDIGGSGVRVASFSRNDRGLLVPGPGLFGGGCGIDPVSGLAEVFERWGRTHAEGLTGTLPVGVAAPGLKTADGRGIERARNLPRTAELLDRLTTVLGELGLSNLCPAPRLFSDGEAALLGETVVAGGLLMGERDVLYLGPGSGLAEVILVGGELRPVTGLRAVDLPPTLEGELSNDLEHEASLLGAYGRYAAALRSGEDRGDSIEEAAAAGVVGARASLERMSLALASLIEYRGEELRKLRMAVADGSPAVLLRTRAGDFFSSPAVRTLVLPRLVDVAGRHGARLIVPVAPASGYAPCAGALALALGDTQASAKP